MQHDYEEMSYMTGIVVSMSVSDKLLLRKGNKACWGSAITIKGFFFIFSLVFFLLFYFILLLLPIHHCYIYCLMMNTCDMMHICSHYC